MSFLKIFSPSDPDLIEKTLSRLAEQDTWNDLFSTKLIDLLDKIDRIRADIRQRIQQADERIQKAESLKVAESTLLRHIAQAEQVKARLSGIESAADTLRTELQAAKELYTDTNTLRSEAENIVVKADHRFEEATVALFQAVAQQERAGELALCATEAHKKSVEALSKSEASLNSALSHLYDAKSSLTTASEKLRHAEETELKAASLAQRAKELSDDASDKYRTSQAKYEEARVREERAARRAALTITVAANAIALSWLVSCWSLWVAVRNNISLGVALSLTVVGPVIANLLARKVRREY